MKGMGGIMDTLKTTVGALGIAFGITFAVQLIVGFFRDSVKAAKEFDAALKNLSAITGAQGEDLKFYADNAKAVGKEMGLSAKEVVEAYKLIGSAKPELLQNKEALAALTKEAIILSQAAGEELPQAATELTDALNQFSAPASEASRYINALAAGSKEGAAEIPDITEALLKFGVAAKASNISIEESVALIETLAEKGQKGAEAGTALRNVLAKLSAPDTLPTEALAALKDAGVDINLLADSTKPLSERLNELAKIQGNASAITRVFGLENKNAAQILIENRGRVDELSKAVTGTSSAYEQAAKNTDTYEFKQKRMSATLEAFQISVGEKLLPILADFIEGITEIIAGADPLISVFVIIGSAASTIIDAFKSLIANFIPMNEGVNSSVGLFNLLAKALKITLIPFQVFVGALQLAVDGLNILINKGKEVANFFGADFKLNPEANFETMGKNLEKNAKGVTDTLKNVFGFQEEEVKKSTESQSKELDKQVDGVKSAEEKKTLITNAERKKQQKEKEKAEKEAKKAAEKAAEDEIKSQELISQKKIQLISDEYEQRRVQTIANADKEIKDLVGSEEQKAQLIKLIRQQQWNELDKMEADRDERKLQESIDMENRRQAALMQIKEIQAADSEDPEAIQEAFLEKLEWERETKLEDHVLLKEEIEAINAEYDQKRENAEEEFQSRRRNSMLQTASTWLQQASGLVSSINALSQAETAKKIDDADKVKNARIAKLDEELKTGKITKDQYDAEKQKADDEYNKKVEKQKREQQKKNKRAAIIQALINTALGISSALQGAWPLALVFAALAGVMGGLQVAAISKQPDSSFAKGGFTAQAPKKGFIKWKDVINHFAVGGFTGGSQATFKDGGWVPSRRIGEIGEAGTEWVAPNWMIKDPKGANIMGYLENVRQKKQFAEGGPTTDPLSGVPSGSTSTPAVDQSNAILQSIDSKLDTLNATVSAWPNLLRVENLLTEVEDGLNELAAIRAQNAIS
jgi:TP901 family phage tail tape measure protein